jgi:hypothetical protein
MMWDEEMQDGRRKKMKRRRKGMNIVYVWMNEVWVRAFESGGGGGREISATKTHHKKHFFCTEIPQEKRSQINFQISQLQSGST